MADSAAEPRRLRWSVPQADVSTNRWLDLQENISRSLQLLIRESIQRDGYIDVVNRPVEQLPRRGRPPQSDGREGRDDDDSFDDGADAQQSTAPSGLPAESRSATDSAAEGAATAPTPESPAASAVSGAPASEQSAPGGEDSTATSGPLDMGSIFNQRD